MSTRTGRRLSSVAVALLLLAAALTPVVALGAAESTTQTQGQLLSLISAAQTSRAYASAAIDYASSQGLNVTSARAWLSQGDTALAAAQTYAQSGSNAASGIETVQGAMRDYTYAAASASVVLSGAGLTAQADYEAATSAIAEVNETASLVASVEAQACVTATGTSAFEQACTQVREDVSSASSQLVQASLLAQGGVGANLTQVLSLVAHARAEIAACQAYVLTIASSTYAQRGSAYVTSVIDPLSAAANATIADEQAVQTDLTGLQGALSTYSQTQASAVAEVSSNASSLAAAIQQVDTASTASSISGAQRTVAQVTTAMNSLLSIQAVATLPVAADIQACLTAGTSYDAALGSAGTQSGAYSQTTLPGFSGYLSALSADASSASSSGTTFVSSYQTVVTDLSALVNIPGVQAILSELESLPVSADVGAATASLQAEASAMATVETGIVSLTSAVSASSSSIVVPRSLNSSAESTAAAASPYLNSTGTAAVAQMTSSLEADAQAAQSFTADANSSTTATVGAYASAESSLESRGTSLGTQTKAAATAAASVAAYLGGDVQSRLSEAASGGAEVSQGLSMFSSLDVAGGAAAMAQAYVELQAAASVSG